MSPRPASRLAPLSSPTPLLRALAPLALLCGVAACTPPQEKIKKVLDEHIASCKKAEGEFAQIEIFDGSTEPVLKIACDEPIEELRLEEKVRATAQTGPYEWTISTHPDSGVWVVSNLQWPVMDDARRVLEMEDPDENTLRSGAEKLAEAQEALPESDWIRRKRLGLLLALREKTRSKEGAKDLAGLGEQAQAYYAEQLEWAAERPEVAAQLRLQVIDYLRDYDSFLDLALESQGSGDEHLENAAKLEEKEGHKDKAAEYRAELEERKKKRAEETKQLRARKEKLRARLCKELAALSPQGIREEGLKERVAGLKSSVECVPQRDGDGGGGE